MPVLPLPEKGVTGRPRFDVQTPAGVDVMVETLAAMEPVKGYSADRRLSEAADQLNLLSATHPEWLGPHRRRLLLVIPDRFPTGFDALWRFTPRRFAMFAAPPSTATAHR